MSDHKEPFVVYRVIAENFASEDELVISKNAEVLDRDYEEVEQHYLEARELIFGDKETEKVLRHTPAGPYYTRDETEIADIVVIGEDEENVEEVFKEEKSKSRQLKQEMLEFRGSKLVPFLEDLLDRFEISFIGFRGDLVMDERFPTPFSDIDVVIVYENPEEIIEELDESPGSVVSCLFSAEKGASDRKLKEVEDAPEVSYDLWTPEDFYKRRGNIEPEPDTYFHHYFKGQEVFFIEEGFDYC